MSLTEEETRVLAGIAMMRHYPDDQGRPIPPWVVDLASGPAPSFHAHDRLMHDRLITCDSGGWRLTDIGREALDRAAPRRATSTAP